MKKSLAATALGCALAICTTHASAQDAPSAMVTGGVAAIVVGSLASVAGGAASTAALATAPRLTPEVYGATFGWSLAMHAVSVATTVYGGVLLSRGRRRLRSPVAATLLPYAGPTGAGIVLTVRF